MLSTQFNVNVARDGHLIFCYGDCNRKYDEALAASREARTGDVMKNMWLDIYNKQYKPKQVTRV